MTFIVAVNDNNVENAIKDNFRYNFFNKGMYCLSGMILLFVIIIIWRWGCQLGISSWIKLKLSRSICFTKGIHYHSGINIRCQVHHLKVKGPSGWRFWDPCRKLHFLESDNLLVTSDSPAFQILLVAYRYTKALRNMFNAPFVERIC
jgi:hypothetical protein